MSYTPTLPADLIFGKPWSGLNGQVTLDFDPLAPAYITGDVGFGVDASGLLYLPIAFITGSATAGLAADGDLFGVAGITGTVLGGGVLADGELYQSRRRLTGGAALPYNLGAEHNHAPAAAWPAGEGVERDLSAPWGDGAQISAANVSAWDDHLQDADRPDRNIAARFDTAISLAEFFDTAWNVAQQIDGRRAAAWGETSPVDEQHGFAYAYPPAKDTLRRFGWNWTQKHDLMMSGPWPAPTLHDPIWPVMPWGDGMPPVYPPIPPLPPAPQPESLPYAGKSGQVDLCFYEAATESTELVFRRRVACKDRGTTAMIHELTLTRLPERTPVKMMAVSLTLSDGDIAWGARIVLPNRNALDLIAPSATGLHEVELTIDGYVWWLLVEGYEEDRRFGDSAFSVSCRSPSAWLSAPYATPRAQNIAQSWTAQQLAENAVAGLGWTINWNLRYQGDDDAFVWSVPAGAWRHDPLTPVEAIMAVAEAAGGVVVPGRAAYSLEVRYRHTVPRWGWNAAAPDVVLPASRIYRVAGRYEPKPEYDKAYVFGEAGGAAAGVTRAGYAGNTPAPTVVDPLNTTVPVCTERGRQILSAAGPRLIQTVEAPFGDGVSPLWPGYLAEIVEDSTWRGVVTGMTISAQRDGETITASQTVTIERAA